MSGTLHERLLTRCDPQWWGLGEERPRWLNALRALIEEHEPCQFLRVPLTTPICETCSADDDLHDVAWPCPPVRTIARELGVEIGETE